MSARRVALRVDQNPLKRSDLDDFVTYYNPNLPDPDVIAREIVKDLEAALQQFAAIANDLKRSQRERSSRLRVRSPYFDASHRPSLLFRLCRNADSAIRVTITGLASNHPFGREVVAMNAFCAPSAMHPANAVNPI